MGLTLRNIITKIDGKNDDLIIEKINSYFPYIKTKKFNSGIEGIVGQINEHEIERETYSNPEKFEGKNFDGIFEEILEFEDNTIEFSKIFPDKKFAYIYVDCFGGTCLYSGFIVENGKVLQNQIYDYPGHISLLKVLDTNYEGFYFEPFTRDFFTKKGEIAGFIYDFSIAGLWLTLKADYPDTDKYYVDGGANNLILRKHNKFYYYFEDKGNRQLEITGTIYDDSSETLKDIEEVITNSFSGLQYKVLIQTEQSKIEYENLK